MNLQSHLQGAAIVTITISLTIENSYELYSDVITYVTDVEVPAPPTEPVDWPLGGKNQGSEQALEIAVAEWAQEHLFCFTGVGHQDGESWYDVTVTDCSDPTMIGRTFAFGY